MSFETGDLTDIEWALILAMILTFSIGVSQLNLPFWVVVFSFLMICILAVLLSVIAQFREKATYYEHSKGTRFFNKWLRCFMFKFGSGFLFFFGLNSRVFLAQVNVNSGGLQ
jgi:hypothetical protein